MTDPDRFDQLIRRRLAAYSREASADVMPPGAHDVYRVVKVRQKRRVAVLAMACLAVLVVLVGTVVQLRRNPTLPITVPPSASPSVQPPSTATGTPSASPSASPSRPPSPTSPSPTPSKTKPSNTPAADPGPTRRSYPVVDGSELHIVALSRVTLRPAGNHYEGVVYVDVYNSGRQTEEYNNVYLTVPGGVQEQPGGPLNIGGCGIPAPPETWICNGAAVPAGGGYVRVWWTVTANTAPSGSAQTIPGFAVRFVAVGQQNTVLTDVTPADNKATTTLVLPAA